MGKIIRNAFLSFLLFAGCCSQQSYYNLQPAQLPQPVQWPASQPVQKRGEIKNLKSLEESLFEDCSDGKLDMPMERAALIASGLDDTTVYERAFEKLSGEIINDVNKKKYESGLERAIETGVQINSRVRHDYPGSRFDLTINPYFARGNCITFSILFDLLCKRQGIKSGIVVNDKQSHAFNFVEALNRKIYIDLVLGGKNFQQYEYMVKDSHEACSREIISHIYHAQAVQAMHQGEIKQSDRFMVRGLRVYPKNQKILEQYVLVCRISNPEESLRRMDYYITQYPDIPSLYIFKAHLLVELGRYKEAEDSLDKAIKLDGSEELKRDKSILRERAKKQESN